MELKAFEGLDAKIREWAGDKAKIELRSCSIAGNEDLYCSVSNGKYTCLVNPEKPDKPYGLRFADEKDQYEFIKGLFKNGKK